MNLWLYSLREMLRRPGRSLLTLLSIVLGVATAFAVSTTIGGARRAFSNMTEALSGKADAEVIARGGGRFSHDLALPVEKAPHVQVAVPMLYQLAMLYAGDKRIQINGVGTVIAKEKMLRPFDIVSGRLPAVPSSEGDDENGPEVVLEESLAQNLGVKTGDTLKILTPRRFQKLQVVGLIRPTEIWAFTQGGLAYFNLEDWQWMCKATGKIDALQIGLVPSADPKKTLPHLASQLPEGLQLRSSHDNQAVDSVTFVAFQYGLKAARTLALVVAVLLILNTFFMNVSERRGQIAVLRLIGATRAQIMQMLLREGVVLGFVGALVGLPLGWLLAHGLARGMESAFAVKLAPAELALGPSLFAFAMGPALATLAAYWPARRAGQIRPLENLRQGASDRTESAGSKKTVVGVVLLVLSVTGMFLSWAKLVSQQVALTVAIFFLIGLLLLLPRVLRPLYDLVYRLLRFLGPTEFGLAWRQLVRTPSRARLTWGILFMAVATSAATGLILTDVIEDIRSEVRRTNMFDFIVRVAQINLATGTSTNLPEDLPEVVRGLPGVELVEAVKALGMEISDVGRVVAVVREFSLFERPPLELPNRDLQAVRRKILDGEIVLSDILAYKLGKKAGDWVAVDFGGKQYTFRIAGTSPFYLAGGMTFFIDRQVAEHLFGHLGADAVGVDAKPGEREVLAGRLRALSQEHGLLFQTYAQIQDRLQGILNTVVASLWILLALGFLIAVIGVTNTIIMNVLEQTREIGLMRVLGMQRRQIRRMILAQSVYVGILAIVPGCVVGVILAHIIRSSSLAILGESPHFGALLPWLFPYALGLLLVVLLFGWLPAARASRLNILDSIRTE